MATQRLNCGRDLLRPAGLFGYGLHFRGSAQGQADGQ